MMEKVRAEKTIGGYPAVFIYRGTWSCGCVYIGQSNNPRARWGRHRSNPGSWGVKEHHEKYGVPKWEIIGDRDGYECGPPANRAEHVMLRWHDVHGTVLNRFGIDWENSSRREPITGRLLSRPRPPRRGYERTHRWQRCHVCHRRMRANNFDSNRSRSSGLASKCKDCQRLMGRFNRRGAEGYAMAKQLIVDWRDSADRGEHPGKRLTSSRSKIGKLKFQAELDSLGVDI